MSQRILIIGCGDTGRRAGDLARARGDQVIGLVRSRDSAGALAEQGIQPLVADLDQPLPALPAADLLFYFAPPARNGQDDMRLRAVLDSLPAAGGPRLVYISTSGVYGDCGGDWVDERRPVNPRTDRARRRVAAEQALQHWGGHYAVLRAPGIYGPGRLPLARLRAGEPVLADADSPWSNRVHVADLAAIALAAADKAPPGAVYNACDGQPTHMADSYRILARLLNYPAPPEISWAQAQRSWSDMRLSFLRESRRLLNNKLGEELGLRLSYPNLEQGIAASLSEQAV